MKFAVLWHMSDRFPNCRSDKVVLSEIDQETAEIKTPVTTEEMKYRCKRPNLGLRADTIVTYDFWQLAS